MQDEKWELVKKQVINEACSNVKNCKMTMIPSIKLEKFINWKEQHGGTNIKPCCKTRMKGITRKPQEKQE